MGTVLAESLYSNAAVTICIASVQFAASWLTQISQSQILAGTPFVPRAIVNHGNHIGQRAGNATASVQFAAS